MMYQSTNPLIPFAAAITAIAALQPQKTLKEVDLPQFSYDRSYLNAEDKKAAKPILDISRGLALLDPSLKKSLKGHDISICVVYDYKTVLKLLKDIGSNEKNLEELERVFKTEKPNSVSFSAKGSDGRFTKHFIFLLRSTLLNIGETTGALHHELHHARSFITETPSDNYSENELRAFRASVPGLAKVLSSVKALAKDDPQPYWKDIIKGLEETLKADKASLLLLERDKAKFPKR